MRKKTKRKMNQTGNRAGKTESAPDKFWAPLPKRRITQADVDEAARRNEVEQQAMTIATLRRRVTELREALRDLELRAKQTSTDISTAMLAHLEAVNKFKDMTALQQEVSG